MAPDRVHSVEGLLASIGARWEDMDLTAREKSLERMRGEFHGDGPGMRSGSESAMEKRMYRAAAAEPKVVPPENLPHEYVGSTFGRRCIFCQRPFKSPIHVRVRRVLSPEDDARITALITEMEAIPDEPGGSA